MNPHQLSSLYAARTLLLLVAFLLTSCIPQATASPTAVVKAPGSQDRVLLPANQAGQSGQTQPPSAATAEVHPAETQPPTAITLTPPASSTPETPAVTIQALAAQAPHAAQTSLTCTPPAILTPALTEGPYFKTGSPERASLLNTDMPGVPLTLSGYVLTSDCQPVANVLLDFWQADSNGVYDNSGYTLCGHQYTDASGHYQLETVIPGLYPGRTEHIHVKVQAPDGPVLTTQLFFPGVSGNESDQIYDPALLIHVLSSGNTMQASYNFIIPLR
jgi:protocatechuate 3,4-dioxygenase beta subunit